jgi:hypothetical protein
MHKRYIVKPVFNSSSGFFVASRYLMEEGWLPSRFHGATQYDVILTGMR